MKNLTFTLDVSLCAMEELDPAARLLVGKAMEATANSYSPYSNFRVGAALRLSDGTIVIGANQENAAYPVGLCAERSAIFAAQSTHPELPIAEIAIAARNADGFTSRPVSPCGSCRQVLLEMGNRYGRSIRAYLYGTEGVYVVGDACDLLPLSFSGSSMR